MNVRPKVLNVSTLEVPNISGMLSQNYEILNLDQISSLGIALEVRGLVTSGHDGASAALIDRLPNLEIIANVGVGYDAVAVKHAAAKGIHITNTPDVLTDDVVDLAVTMMVWLTRKLSALPGSGITPSLRGKTLGILGMGRIGNKIAVRAAIMRMNVSYTNRKKRADTEYHFVPNAVDLARESDVLIVAMSASPDARHIVNKQLLEALGPHGIFINVSRGSLVDQAALIGALQSGSLGGAGLDVYENEPNVPKPLLSMERVMLTPHIGSATVETRIAMAQLAIANLDAHFSGKPLPTEVPETRLSLG